MSLARTFSWPVGMMSVSPGKFARKAARRAAKRSMPSTGAAGGAGRVAQLVIMKRRRASGFPLS